MVERFARTMYRRRRFVVAAWVFALVAVIAAGSMWGGEHRVDYTTPGSDSARAQQLFGEKFPTQAGDTVQLVFAAPAGVESPAVASRITSTLNEAKQVAHVRAVPAPMVSRDGTVAVATVQLDATAEKVPLSTIHSLMHVASAQRGDGLNVEAGGAAVQNAESGDSGSEGFGMLAAIVILLIAFGSVLAAGLPVLVALFGLGVALASVELLNRIFMVPDWAPTLMTMIGIGIGIDYALFIITRYRSALAAGEEPEDAVVTALSTAGRAVLFAGGTVVISLLGLTAMGLNYLYGTAAATVTGVLIVLIASITLLPAILGFAGRNIDRLHIPFVKGDAGDKGLWARWSHVVQRRPSVTGLVAFLLLAALTIPYLSLRFGYPDAGTGPHSATSRRAYDLVDRSFGPGANGPLVVAAEVHGDGEAVARAQRAIGQAPGVAQVSPVQTNAAGDTAAFVVYPTTGPQDEATVHLVDRLRNDVVPAALGTSRAELFVGGQTAATIDESRYTSARLPLFIGAVLVLSFLLLLVVFRSLLVAAKAAVMNVLSIGAAYGVMALALQGGWFGHLIGIESPTPVPAWVPMMMFALLFGLSMDYEVFLLSRIREDYVATGDNRHAVAMGMARTGRVITAAAAIMVTVFASFLLGDQVIIKVIGLGLSTAVLLDATVVRMVLVPSTMSLLGDRNWWLPRWLDRVLPHVHIEREAAADVESIEVAPARAA